MKMWVSLGLALLALAVFSGCGEKTPFPSDLPAPVYGGVDTNYVVVNPVWTEFNGRALTRPTDVYVGYDEQVYVCDTDNDRVVKLELDGSFVDEYPVVHPVAISQDRGLDLLVVCGDYSRTIIAEADTTEIWYGDSVFRKRFRGNHPFERVYQAQYPYFIFNERPQHAQFWSVAASTLAGKDYYLPDFWFGRILKHSATDQLAAIILEEGIGIGKTRYPLDLYPYRIAEQDYIALAQGASNVGVQVFSLPDWISPFADVDTLPPMIRFSARAYKDIAVDDQSNFYLLLDEPDPLLGADYFFYKYDRRGETMLAFGALGSGDKQFRSPQGICHFDGILYIADTGNNRVIRYQLTTETRQ